MVVSGDGGASAAAPAEEREERIRVIEREVFLVQMKTNFGFPFPGPLSPTGLRGPGPTRGPVP